MNFIQSSRKYILMFKKYTSEFVQKWSKLRSYFRTQGSNNGPIARIPREFCNQTTIHGVRYITEKKRHWSERLWWAIAFGVSLCFCIVSINLFWVSWNERPVKISYMENGIRITEFPFPTVTICPKIKTTRAKLDLVSLIPNRIFNDSHKNDKRMRTLPHLCSFFKRYGHFDDQFADESIYDIMTDIAPTIDIMTTCLWQDQLVQCSEIFVPILTKFGLCFAFNAVNSREIYTDEMAPSMMMVTDRPNISNWTYENGYEEGLSEKQYPWRTSNYGQRAGLIVFFIFMNDDLNYLCDQSGIGFTVTLTLPVESNEMSVNLIQAPLFENTQISITPEVTYTSDKLQKYSPTERKCYIHNERELRFFKYYTQRNCAAECLANFTKQICGCVKFQMPRDRNTRICGAGKIDYYLSAEKTLSTDYFDSNASIADTFRRKCACLPACTSMDFKADVDHIRYDMEILQKTGIERNTRPARLAISFRDHLAKTQQRMETMTIADFLAGCGGLLGLFLGVSALSIVELIYYFTLRLFWNIRRSNDVVPLQN